MSEQNYGGGGIVPPHLSEKVPAPEPIETGDDSEVVAEGGDVLAAEDIADSPYDDLVDPVQDDEA